MRGGAPWALLLLAAVVPTAVEGVVTPIRASRAVKVGVAASKAGVAYNRFGAECSRLGAAYSNLCRDNFLLMATLQSATLRGAADVVGQGMHHGSQTEHVLAMAMIGGLVSGLGNAHWLRVLERWYGTEQTQDVVLRKTATDYLCWAPFANGAYLYGLPLLTGRGAEAALTSLGDGFLAVMALELAIFMPYNLIAFERLPLAVRPLTSAMLAAFYTICVGMLA